MDTWTRIERGGFYPRAVKSALRRALGGTEPLATLCQVDTGFDRGAVFRHLTIASLTERAIIQLHVDELEGGSVSVATAMRRARDIAGYSTMEVYADPENAAQCEDPHCVADHGFTGTSFPDDMTFRISAAADGQDALAEGLAFVERLAHLSGTRSGAEVAQ